MIDLNAIGSEVVDSAVTVHRALGPGLLESVYEAAMLIELRKRRLEVNNQVPIPVLYQGSDLGVGFRADLVVERSVLIELKSVERVVAIHRKTALNYMRLANLKLGYLINFNNTLLNDGLERLVNGLNQEPAFLAPRSPRAPREINPQT